MPAMTFKYNKDGKISDRVFIPITHPSEKYFGIDITELDIEDQGTFLVAVEDIIEEQKQKIAEVMEKYDLKYKFRSFFKEQMTEVVFD